MKNHNFNDIIKNVQKNLTCPMCGRNYDLQEIKLRGFFDEIYIFQTFCSKKHSPLSSIFIAGVSKKNIHTKLKTSANPRIDLFNKQDINNLHKQIDEFDGDFIKLWKQ